jgi:transmembrane sensor
VVSEFPAPRPSLASEAAHWHALQRQGGLTAEQQRQFMTWLVTSPAHLREYITVSRVATELGDALRDMAVDLDALIAAGPPPADDNVVALPVRRRPPPPAASRAPRRHLPGIAAAAALLLGVAFAGHMAWPQTRHYVAAHGAPQRFALPDHTVVHLNAESELSIRFTLLSRRVELSRGQASFVVAEERRPFAVHAAGLEVRDIGTTFDVSLRREQARIEVAEGSVQIRGDSGQGRLLADLRAGQSAHIDYRDQTVSLRQQHTDTMTAWWRRRVVFQDEPLREVVEQFNRLNNVRLQVDDDVAGALRLTGNLRGDDLASLRTFLDQQPSLRTRVVDKQIHVSSPSAAEINTKQP